MTGPALGLAAFGDHDLPDALARAAAAGFTAVDLQLDSTLPMTGSVDLTSEAGLARLRDQVAAEGLTAVCVSNVRDAELLLGPHGRHSDGVLVGSAAQKRAHAVRWSRWTVDAAVALGSPFARLYLGCPDHLLMFPWHGLAAGWSENLEVLAASAAEVFGYARERGVTVCVEPHPRQAIFTLPSFQQASRLLADDGHRLGMCLDPANLVAGGLDALEYVEAMTAPPEFVHFKDVETGPSGRSPRGPGWRQYGPGRPVRFRNAGRGELPWPSLRDRLFDLGFAGTVVIEFEDLTVPREAGIADALDAARRLFAGPTTREQWW